MNSTLSGALPMAISERLRPQLTARQGMILGAVLLVATGCGYTTERPFKPTVESVHVEMFRSKVFWQDIEYMLTEAVVKRIEMDTPYRIAERGQADSVLTGEVIDVKQATLGKNFITGLPREKGVTYVVSFRWQDLRTGKMLSERERFAYTTTYIPPVGQTFYDASVRGLDGLAEELVEAAMESNW